MANETAPQKEYVLLRHRPRNTELAAVRHCAAERVIEKIALIVRLDTAAKQAILGNRLRHLIQQLLQKYVLKFAISQLLSAIARAHVEVARIRRIERVDIQHYMISRSASSAPA